MVLFLGSDKMGVIFKFLARRGRIVKTMTLLWEASVSLFVPYCVKLLHRDIHKVYEIALIASSKLTSNFHLYISVLKSLDFIIVTILKYIHVTTGHQTQGCSGERLE